MRIALVVTACVLMMAGAHALRLRYRLPYYALGPGMYLAGCFDQDGNRASCDGVYNPFDHLTVTVMKP